MPHSHSDPHPHPHADDCGCSHDHDHGRDHGVGIGLGQRWLISLVIVAALLFVLRPFIISQMLVRVTSYSANSSYENAVRMCHKIIALDKKNIQAWTSLGYAYMDLNRPEEAIAAFDQVLTLNPEDKGAASFELGQAYYAKGDLKRAIEYFERVRMAGAGAGALLEADILKYRHGTMGFRSLNSMETLLADLAQCYKQTGHALQAAEVQKQYTAYKSKHSRILF